MNKGDQVTEDFKSVFLTNAEDMKANLGHAMCLAKWKQRYITAAGRFLGLQS